MFLLVPAYPGSPGQKAVKRLCVCIIRTVSNALKYKVYNDNTVAREVKYIDGCVLLQITKKTELADLRKNEKDRT